MGLGKTFVGSEKAMSFYQDILVICQKSKINDWLGHFKEYYECDTVNVYDLSDSKDFERYNSRSRDIAGWSVAIINYDLVWRRKINIKDFTLMLDESSLIQNRKSKRTKAVLKLKADNVVLLSGTPTDGKYERLWTQCKLLGWDISESDFWDKYVKWRNIKFGTITVKQVYGYKHIRELKNELKNHGCVFMKTDEVIYLPEQVDQIIKCDVTSDYKKFVKNDFLEIDGTELIGDNSLTKILYRRQLCSQYNPNKLASFLDIVDSTSDRLIVFYNFTAELDLLKSHINKPVSIVNGEIKDLENYENCDDSVTFVQYQAGAYGLNLQKARRIVYFSLPLSSEQFEQSKKRTHRIGQKNTCFYYMMICKKSIEEDIYKSLLEKKDYTDRLFNKNL